MEFMLPFKKMISDRNITLKYKIIEGMEEGTKFCLDWRVYKSILYHIVSNAIKFSNPKGKIGIEVQYQEAPEFDIDGASDDSIGLENLDGQKQSELKLGFLNTIVIDNGVGMDEVQLKKLGKSF
jgi:signal transduction histidine kinase